MAESPTEHRLQFSDSIVFDANLNAESYNWTPFSFSVLNRGASAGPTAPLHQAVIVCLAGALEHIKVFPGQKIRNNVINRTEVPVGSCSTSQRISGCSIIQHGEFCFERNC